MLSVQRSATKETAGVDKRIWSLRHAMYACKFFPESKTADHIQVAIDKI